MSDADSEARAVLDKIRGRAGYLKSLVQGLVEYSREIDLDFRPEPLAPIVAEALALAVAKSQERFGPQAVSQTVVVTDDLVLEACRPRLLQALTNVISNAVEALADRLESKSIEVKSHINGGDRVVLMVTDNGGGMDPGQVDNAKKRFRSLKKGKGGIGLGLPLAIKIIEREHRGRLDIESEKGAGTTVTIELPLRREEQD